MFFFVVDHFVLFLLVDNCVPGDMVTITGVAKVTTSEESKKINVYFQKISIPPLIAGHFYLRPPPP